MYILKKEEIDGNPNLSQLIISKTNADDSRLQKRREERQRTLGKHQCKK